MKSHQSYDILIIGGGIVGTSILHELSKFDLRIALLERHSDVAEGVTKANSGVLHAGFMVLPGTLKARLNVEGRPMYVQQARELGVPVKNCKKLVVARDSSELPYLKRLLDQGQKSRVPGLSLIDRDTIRALQPNVSGEYAILSEETSVTLPYQMAIAMAENSVLNGASVFLNSEVVGISFEDKFYRVTDQSGLVYNATVIIDAAGLHADQVMDSLTACPETTYPWRGEYHLLEEASTSAVDMAVYPVPPKDGSGLGVHITPTVNGGILLGPSADSINDPDDTRNTRTVLEQLKREAFQLVPALREFKTIKNYSGVRPKLFGPQDSTTFRDFVIDESGKYPGFIYLLGIESPGVTAALAIAKYVVDRFVSNRLELKEQKDWQYRYAPIPRFRWMTEADQHKILSEYPDFGHILCHCELVSKEEIRRAVSNQLGSVSINAIRKRTHATLGKCQSSFCLGKISAAMRSWGYPTDSIQKGTPATRLFHGVEQVPE